MIRKVGSSFLLVALILSTGSALSACGPATPPDAPAVGTAEGPTPAPPDTSDGGDVDPTTTPEPPATGETPAPAPKSGGSTVQPVPIKQSALAAKVKALTDSAAAKARSGAIECFTGATWGSTLAFFRPSGLGLENCVEDLLCVLPEAARGRDAADYPIDGVIWPKAEHPGELAWLCEILDSVEAKLGLPENRIRVQFLVESGYALSQLAELAQACLPRLAGIVWGIADYSADANLPTIRNDHPLCDWARFEIVNLAGAVGVPLPAILPLFVAIAAPAATQVLRAGVPTLSDADAAMIAAAMLVVTQGLPTSAMPAAAAAFGGGLLAAAAAVVAPVLGVVATDYFFLRGRALDTRALVDGGGVREGGPFWFWRGVNPRAAIAAALIILLTGWWPADPLLSLITAVLIGRTGWSLAKRTGHVLLEGAPEEFDADAVRRRLIDDIDAVGDVHHLHSWSLKPGLSLMTLHVCLRTPDADADATLHAVHELLAREFGCDHVTVQIEPGVCPDDAGQGHPTAAH